MISSPLLSTLTGLVHSFGTKAPISLPDHLVTAKQVHGTKVLVIEGEVNNELAGFDILITGKKGTAVGIRTADCLPILLTDPVAGLVAAVHAGWRGTLAGVAPRAVEVLIEKGAKEENLHGSLGPSIGRCCYEIGAEVAVEFERAFSGHEKFLKRKSDAKWVLGLAEANRWQLIEAGIQPERIDRIELCTHCRPDLFHSFRRDGEKAGRMVSFIQLL